jgi:prolipoprotein diacylglyceryltransferase
VAFEASMALNMGQWLSIPLVAVGAFFVLRPLRQHK